MKEKLKKVYNALPFKMQIFSFVKLFWKPNRSIYQHLHFTGIIKVPIGKLGSFKMKHYGFQIENDIFWSGLTNGWEKVSTNLWITLCKNASVILDIGANTGIYALIAKTINPGSKVYAFEPVKRVFEKLEENITLNKFDIIAFEKAVSNSNGTAVIYDDAGEHIYSVTVNKNMVSPGVKAIETKIETITLNSFIRQNNLSHIDLIKIDVETHEPEVLQGFNEYLSVFKPTMLVEVLDDEVGEKINNIVSGLGYLYFNIDEEKGIRQVTNITKSDYYNYLFCDEKVARELGLI
ncbi:MAG: FkbM family methyltransferase [Ferruginibacter sp.]